MVSSAFVTDKIDADVAVVEQVEKSVPAPESTAEDVAVQPATQTDPTPVGSVKAGTETVQAGEPEKKSWLGRLVDNGKEVAAKAIVVVKGNVKKWDPRAMKEKIEKVVPQMLNLMSLFLLETLILPLVFLYGLKYALGQVWNIKPIPLYTGKPRLTM
jgi:hypothetical protein